jgi:acetyltransferase-like isoleucine patch superfamily enzyme
MNLVTKLGIFTMRAIDRVRLRLAVEYVTSRLGSVGKNLAFDPMTSHFATPSTTFVGDDCFFNVGLVVSGNVRFGNRVIVGPYVSINSGNHLFAIPGRSVRHLRYSLENPEFVLDVTVEDEVWLGARCAIVGGVTVGMGAIVGAGAVVIGDVAPFTINVGNPARPVRRIFSDDALRDHLRGLGVAEQEAATIVEKRAAILGSSTPPIVDNRARFRRYYYHGQLVDNVDEPPAPEETRSSVP